MYLGDVEEGGETTLPLGKYIDEGRQRLANSSECCLALFTWRCAAADAFAACPPAFMQHRFAEPTSRWIPVQVSTGAHVQQLNVSCLLLLLLLLLLRQASVLPRAADLRLFPGRVMRCCSGTCTLMAQQWTGQRYTPAAPHSR
jgi:hypothetical protein